MSEIQLPELPKMDSYDPGRFGVIYTPESMQTYARAAVEFDRESRPAGEAVAWLEPGTLNSCEPDRMDWLRTTEHAADYKHWFPVYATPPAVSKPKDGEECPTCGCVQFELPDFDETSFAVSAYSDEDVRELVEKARNVTRWDWSDNDEDCVGDVEALRQHIAKFAGVK